VFFLAFAFLGVAQTFLALVIGRRRDDRLYRRTAATHSSLPYAME
jgi:hypothetical protein